MTENTLHIIDYTLMAAGGLVLAGGSLCWGRTGWRDPLRGSPLRVNRLGIAHVWLCLAVMLLGWSAGGRIAAWIAPPGLDQQPLQIWQSIFAADFGAVLNTVTCLLVAWTAFPAGLRGFGIGRRRPGAEIAWGLGGWLAALALTGGILILSEWVILRLFPQFQAPKHGVFIALENPHLRPWMRAFAVIGAVSVVPVGEEVLFRGILQTAVQKLVPARRGSLLHRWVAILVIGSLFGAVHSATPQFVPALMALGVLLGFLYERTGSLLVPILVHMLFNGKSLLLDYLARNYLQNQ